VADRQALVFAAYGVTVRVVADRAEPLAWLRARLDSLLPGATEAAAAGQRADVELTVGSAKGGGLELGRDGVAIGSHPSSEVALAYFASRLKLAVAERAPAHVFVHAGVAATERGALVLPASSWQGKTTLVAELVRRGAVYYSDDFAVFDAQGRVLPFAKPLSVRSGGDLRQRDIPVESFGGRVGVGPQRVDAILFTHYSSGSLWNPQPIRPGQALLAMLPHTLSIHRAPARSLAVLAGVVAEAACWQAPRGEAGEVGEWMLGRAEPGRSR
jgi:hypothetical protein